MGRFMEYINEGKNVLKIDNIEEMLELVEKDCKPFLTEIRKKKGFVLRRDIHNAEDFLRITPRKDRRPLDTDIKLHNRLDKAFYNVFGWKARSEGVFTMPKGWSFGDHFFFPIGEYKYIWSPFVEDLFNERKGLRDAKILEDWIKYKGYTDKGMVKNENCEMMFKCKEYYAISKDWKKEIKRFIHG